MSGKGACFAPEGDGKGLEGLGLVGQVCVSEGEPGFCLVGVGLTTKGAGAPSGKE